MIRRAALQKTVHTRAPIMNQKMKNTKCVKCRDDICDPTRIIKPCGHMICNESYFALKKDICPLCYEPFDIDNISIGYDGGVIHVVHCSGRIAKDIDYNISNQNGRWKFSTKGHKAVPDDLYEIVKRVFKDEDYFLNTRLYYRNGGKK